ncbi:glycosyltransferase [Patescibacteria group bacterium]|nr:glycosyltransferase [Patescibacteria group bacterium]
MTANKADGSTIDHLLFNQPHLIAKPMTNAWELIVRFTIIIAFLFIFYSTITGNVFQPLIYSIENLHWSRLIIRPSILWASMGILLLIFRTILWFRYRPFPAADMAEAPFLTVIIPAYNEGAMVENSINSVATAQYPNDRLEIFVVDDGSKDDTWEYIQAAARRYPHLVTPVRFLKNKGKRAALEAGFRQARGEIFVTIDSDSVIEPQTLLAIAGPFRDSRVGAVAGKVMVYNRYESIIPRMLHVRYILSFDFLRAVQSTYRTVYCCPGALSAYRASVVKKVIDPWMHQTFLGQPCTYGEDRSMTNFVLSQRYDTVYQQTAIVHTNAPVTYSKLCRMFLRWDRSYIKEELRFALIVWKRPLRPRLISIFDQLITNLRFPVSYFTLVLVITLTFADPYTLVRLLFVMGMMSLLNMLYYLHSERSWDFIYGVFYSYFAFFSLFWIFPTAVFTVRSRSWMTR